MVQLPLVLVSIECFAWARNGSGGTDSCATLSRIYRKRRTVAHPILILSLSILNINTIYIYIYICLVASNSKQQQQQQKPVISKEAQRNFQKWRPYLVHCNDFFASAAGGWRHVESLAENPKQELVNYIIMNANNNNEKVQVNDNDETLHALVGLLQAQGKGYDSNIVEGDWVSVLSQQGRKSPKIQKLVGKREKRNNAHANFVSSERKFYGQVKILKWGDLRSTVAVCALHIYVGV